MVISTKLSIDQVLRHVKLGIFDQSLTRVFMFLTASNAKHIIWYNEQIGCAKKKFISLFLHVKVITPIVYAINITDLPSVRNTFEPRHDISNNVEFATCNASMTVKLLTEHHLQFLSLTGGCTGSSESIHVKMPSCWKSHVPYISYHGFRL